MTIWLVAAAAVVLAVPVMADTFGSGDNQFTLDFVPISANPGETRSTNTSGSSVSTNTNGTVGPWTDPGYDYRMSTYQITNAQWAAFEAETGLSFTRYYWSGDAIPANQKNWYAMAQFVNWLNTEHGHQAAYNFSGGTFSLWDASDAWGGTNLYRHKDAFYFLPTEDEWVKAAYWNGSSLQTWATIDDTEPVRNVDSRYGSWDLGPWAVGSGSEEINGTFDMMANVWERIESPHQAGGYTSNSRRGVRGGSSHGSSAGVDNLASSLRKDYCPYYANRDIGFRVASVPEPATIGLLGLGGFAVLRKRQTSARRAG